MVAEDTWGKLEKIAKLAILRALVFGSNYIGFRESKSASKAYFIILPVTSIYLIRFWPTNLMKYGLNCRIPGPFIYIRITSIVF